MELLISQCILKINKMVKFCQGSKHFRNNVKIGFSSIIEARRANKYLGKNEEYPTQLSLDIGQEQRKVLDDNFITYYIVGE